MNHSKVTKYAFNLADVVSWFFVILAILSLVAVFIPPPMTTWSIIALPPIAMVSLETANNLISGAGFYLIIKRKIYGFALIIISQIANLTFSKFAIIDIFYLPLIILFIVGLPWAMSYKEVQNENKT